MGGKGPDEQTTTTEQRLPEWAEPYAQRLLPRLEASSQRPAQFFPGQTYVDPSAQTLQALDLQEGLATGASPIMDPAFGALSATLRGDNLTAPALEAATRSAVNRVLPDINAQFIAGGRTGSPAQAEAVTSAIGDIVAQQANVERGRQMQALTMAPGMEAARYAPAQELARIGAAREAIAGQPLAEEMARHQFAQGEEPARLAQYAGLLQGVLPTVGGVTTQTTPIHRPSPFSQMLGLGLTGLGVASGLGWAPFAASAAAPTAAGAGLSAFTPFGGAAFMQGMRP